MDRYFKISFDIKQRNLSDDAPFLGICGQMYLRATNIIEAAYTCKNLLLKNELTSGCDRDITKAKDITAYKEIKGG